MDLLNLSEAEIEQFKNDCLLKGTVFQSDKVTNYDNKFFETVTVSNTLIKGFLFFSLGLYALVNLIGNILTIIYNSYRPANNPLVTMGGVLLICLIFFAIFSNINTNQKKEENPLWVSGKNLIFQFNNGMTDTPDLFYCLPYTSVERIEFLVQRIRKQQLFGSVTVTCRVADYTVQHTLRFTNLTKLEQFLQKKFPSLLDNLLVDGKGKNYHLPVTRKQKLTSIGWTLGLLIGGVGLIVLPHLLPFPALAVSIAGVLLIVTAIMVSLSGYLYTFHLLQGLIISCVFTIMGVCVPLLVIELSGVSFGQYVLQDVEVLMPTVFGIIGVCLLVYQMIIIVGKIRYRLTSRVK